MSSAELSIKPSTPSELEIANKFLNDRLFFVSKNSEASEGENQSLELQNVKNKICVIYSVLYIIFQPLLISDCDYMCVIRPRGLNFSEGRGVSNFFGIFWEW